MGLALPAVAAEQSRVQRFDLPAGALAGEAALTTGKSVPALHGSYTVDQALQAVSAGSELTVLQPGAGGAVQLGAVSISGMAPCSTTEGTGLYTTYSSSSSTRFNLTQKETPQSVTVITRQRLDDQKLTYNFDPPDGELQIHVLMWGRSTYRGICRSAGYLIEKPN